MADKIEKIIKDGFEQADSPLKKVGVAAAVVAAGPAVIAGIAGEKGIQGAKAVVKKVKEENTSALLKKFNPVFPEEFHDTEFSLPNMIIIVDDAERKNVEVCKGAIGWKSIENGMEVMHLYDNAVVSSGLNFSPVPMCNAIYYLDPHRSTSFVNIDNLYESMQQEKLAELSNVANCLGAKSYSVEIVEEEKVIGKVEAKAKAGAKVKVVDANIDAEHKENTLQHGIRRAYVTTMFYEKKDPTVPALCWFADDHNIQGLIKHVCQDHGRMKSQTLIFEGSKHAVMSRETAARIDAAVKKLGAKAIAKMEKKAESEYSSKIIFKIEF